MINIGEVCKAIYIDSEEDLKKGPLILQLRYPDDVGDFVKGRYIVFPFGEAGKNFFEVLTPYVFSKKFKLTGKQLLNGFQECVREDIITSNSE